MSNDHPFYYGLFFTVIMIYMLLSFAILEITLVERCQAVWLAVHSSHQAWVRRVLAWTKETTWHIPLSCILSIRCHFYSDWMHKWKFLEVCQLFITKLFMIFSTLCQNLKEAKRHIWRETWFDTFDVTLGLDFNI